MASDRFGVGSVGEEIARGSFGNTVGGGDMVCALVLN
jgi:hypothetical protein